MSGNTEDLLDKLSDLLQKAFSLPFGADRCIVDRDKVLGLIDEVRDIMPSEIEQACQIVERGNDLINEAKREAAAIRRQAEERALAMVNENKIVQDARAKAREIDTQARARERELKLVVNDYVEQTLKRLDEVSSQAIEDVQRAHRELQKARAEFQKQARLNEQG